jgi:hypothetical protein
MDTKIFTDPAKIGPGIWFSIHIEAVHATDDNSKNKFITNINNLCDNFKCQKCKPHFRKFIDTHPLTNYWNIKDNHGNDIGFFKWSWELHNQVNKFLNKPQPSLSDAYSYYSSSSVGICFDCHTTNNNNDNNNNNINNTTIPAILIEYLHSNKNNKPFKLLKH